jgi:hypothetical protein
MEQQTVKAFDNPGHHHQIWMGLVLGIHRLQIHVAVLEG